jgi:hypothetical protein
MTVAATGLDGEQLVAEPQAALPTLLDPYVGAAVDYTAVWYDELTPDQSYCSPRPVA